MPSDGGSHGGSDPTGSQSGMGSNGRSGGSHSGWGGGFGSSWGGFSDSRDNPDSAVDSSWGGNAAVGHNVGVSEGFGNDIDGGFGMEGFHQSRDEAVANSQSGFNAYSGGTYGNYQGRTGWIGWQQTDDKVGYRQVDLKSYNNIGVQVTSNWQSLTPQTLTTHVENMLAEATNKYGREQVRAKLNMGMPLGDLTDLAENTLGEWADLSLTIFSMVTNPLAGIFAAPHAAMLAAEMFSKDIDTAERAAMMDHYSSQFSKLGGTAAALMGLSPLATIGIRSTGLGIGMAYGDYAAAARRGDSAVGQLGGNPGPSSNEGGSDWHGSVLSGEASSSADTETEFSISPSSVTSSKTKWALLSLYLLPLFNSNSSFLVKGLLSRKLITEESMQIPSFDYDGMFGSTILDIALDASGAFLFVKAIEGQGTLF